MFWLWRCGLAPANSRQVLHEVTYTSVNSCDRFPAKHWVWVTGGGLVMGAVLGSHWCDVIVQGLLGPRFRRWVRQPKQRVLWNRISWATSVLGCVLGPVIGAVTSFLFGLFFVGLLLAYLAQSLGLFLFRSTYSPLVVVVRLLSKTSRSGLWSAAVSAVAGMSESAVETVEMIQANKDGFDRKNYQQVEHYTRQGPT